MLLSLLKLLLLVYLGLGVYLYFAQRSFMYFPVAERDARDAQSEYLSCGGARLKVWVVNPGRQQAVLYFGGNAEDVGANASDFHMTLPTHTVYLVNYRGYGGSSGSPGQDALFADAQCVFDAVSGRHREISLIGRSLGSGVAVSLATRRPVRRLVLVSAYDSALSIAQRLYPIYPLRLLMKDPYLSVRYAPQVVAPTLIISAENDRIVPPEHSRRLAGAFAPGRAQQVGIDGADHNDLAAHRRYWGEIARFLGE